MPLLDENALPIQDEAGAHMEGEGQMERTQSYPRPGRGWLNPWGRPKRRAKTSRARRKRRNK